MYILGITGGTGSGTSTIGHMLENKGFLFIDCDKVYHELLSNDKALRQKLINRFGRDILTPEERIDRRQLGKIVFGDKTALADLNSITHSRIAERVLELIEDSERDYIVIEAVALIESGMNKICTAVIGVIADDETRAYRIMIRDALSKADALKRIKAQKDNDYYKQHCNYIIENNGTLEELSMSLENILSKVPEANRL